jgi:hypothetical protein
VTNPRRRQAGEGGIIEYKTRAGVRYAVKYRIPQEDARTSRFCCGGRGHASL